MVAEIRENMALMVETAGGVVSDKRFVEKPGVVVLNAGNGLTPIANELVRLFNINTDQSSSRQLSELAARITYFKFPKKAQSLEDSNHFHDRLAASGHLSPYDASSGVSILFAGISLETALEIIANKGNVGRTTSSRTDAMIDPLFALQGPEKLRLYQRNRILAALNDKTETLRQMCKESGVDLQNFENVLDQTLPILRASLGLSMSGKLSPAQKRELDQALENLNKQDPGSKATFLIDAKPARQWGWLFSGRLSEANTVEAELVDVLTLAADNLNAVIPEVIRPSLQYTK